MRWRIPVMVVPLLGSALMAGGVVVPTGTALAASATFMVTSTADSGAGSLRQAITDAEATADDDTIVFDAGVFAPGTSHTITLVTALPTITKSLTITGPGQDVLTISGDDTVIIFNTSGQTAGGIDFAVSDVTLTRGHNPSPGYGGAIRLHYTQSTLTRVTITDSYALQGGAIYSGFSALTMTDSLIEGNTAASAGGGIRSDYDYFSNPLDSVLRVVNTVIRDNSAPAGGGIYAARPMVLIDDTITGNVATTGNGGGVWVGYAYDHTIQRTLISGNTAVSGGGIDVGTPGRKGRLTISDSVVRDNVATSADGSGGIMAGDMILQILDSTITNGAEGDCVPTWRMNGSYFRYTNIVDLTGTSMGDSSCGQLDRAALVYSFTAASAGAVSVATTAGDPPFLVDDSVSLCRPGACDISRRMIGRVVDVSTADDTFAFIPTTNITSFSDLGMPAAAWVDLPKIISATPDSGVEGDLVTLTGSGFGDPAAGPTVSVTVGGVSASGVTHVDDTTITFVAPAGPAGSVAVAVGSNASTSAVTWGSRAGVFAYPAAPTPPEPEAPVIDPPAAPEAVSAVAGDASAVVSWSPPASSGSFAVSTYQVMSSPGGKVCMTSGLTCTVWGLANGIAYTFSVKALSGAGWGPWSAVSNVVTPEAPVVPSIVISGSREGRKVVISGTSTGLGMGAIMRPWLRRVGESSFRQGKAAILVDVNGDFEWSRRSKKKVTVYVATPDGSLESNRVRIR